MVGVMCTFDKNEESSTTDMTDCLDGSSLTNLSNLSRLSRLFSLYVLLGRLLVQTLDVTACFLCPMFSGAGSR